MDKKDGFELPEVPLDEIEKEVKPHSGDGKDEHGYDIERHAGYGWLLFCVLGMITSLTMYGVVLEYATSGQRKLHELSFLFVTTSIYTITAYVARWLFGEKPSPISKYQMLVLSVTSLTSTFTSVRSLRYVIYPVQVLFKSCKPVPVMAFGLALGKKYPIKKYVNVMIITTGVALFMSGGKSASKPGPSGSSFLGVIMLSISLCFDGATGAYEDKLMARDAVEPFDLMYNIQLGKAVISFCSLVALNQLPHFLDTVLHGGFQLILLGLTGALGQVFVFVTIAKFGALNCALIGLGRKLLSLALSFLLYGHTMNAIQTVGLGLAVVSMVANFYDKGRSKLKKHVQEKDREEADISERISLVDDQDEEEEKEEDMRERETERDRVDRERRREKESKSSSEREREREKKNTQANASVPIPLSSPSLSQEEGEGEGEREREKYADTLSCHLP
mmetsp:Transcript_21199/g.21316  ORF Transcript_21199/g.21316 Transcript_21199/m.21316 type:complete len:448 (-) Transcript_21199:160-1503(-)